MALKQELVEKRNRLEAINKKIAKVREESKADNGEFDLMKASELDGKDSNERLHNFRKMIAETEDLGGQVDKLAAAMKSLEAEPEREERGFVPEAQKQERKTIGQMIVESPKYKAMLDNRDGKGGLGNFAIQIPMDMKTLITRAAGFAPESLRTGEIVPYAYEPVKLFAMIPKAPTSYGTIKYMEETTRTQAAAGKAEGSGTYAESTFVTTEQSVTVETIGHSAEVTDEQVEDAPQFADFIDTEMRNGIMEALDSYLLNGSGSTPAPLGVLNVSTIQTHAAAGDTMVDAFFKAMMEVVTTGKTDPTVSVIHPLDFQTIRLERTADGVYVWGNPADIGPMRLWGLPLVYTTNITRGYGLTGDMAKFAKYFELRGIVIEMTDSHNTDFLYGIKRIRASVRGAFRWSRPTAFNKLTGLT